MNSHIKEYLKSYVKLDDPQYAVMIKGEWGSGKTHFIKEYIKKYSENSSNESKVFIYVSIFGLRNTSSIDELIFQQLHPVLASKSAKLVGGFLKSAVKLGLKYDIDLNKNKDNEGDISLNLDNFNPIGFVKDRDLPNKVFVFDDFERSMIDMAELLGYINSMVEQSALKVIIIANEKEINNDSTYSKFREKVINKSFVLKSDVDGFFDDYISNDAIFNQHSTLIKKLFDMAGLKNYRVLIQCIENYKYFIKVIDDDYLDNEDFSSILVEQFVIKSLIYKNNLSKDKIESFKDDLRSRYAIFQESVWKNIVEDFNFDKEDVNNKISKLHFFQKDEKEESWRILWNYSLINSKVFYENLSDMVGKYKEFYYESPVVLLHVVELLILFEEKGIETTISPEDVKAIAIDYISKFSNTNEKWIKSEGISNFFNFTGLGFINEDNPTVIEIRKKINLSLEDGEKNQEKNRIDNELKNLIENIKSGNQEKILNFFLVYETTPVLQNLDAKDIFELLIDDSSRNVFEIGSALVHRYSESRYLNSKPYYSYLLKEADFLKELKSCIVNYEESDEAKPFIVLKLDMLKSALDNSIARLNAYQE